MRDVLVENKRIYDLEIQFLHIFGWISKIIFVLFFIGFFQVKPLRFLEINFVIKVLLAVFLIYRFNKFRKQKIVFTELDQKVAYSAGVYILFLSFADLLEGYTLYLRSKITPYTLPLVDNIKKMYENQKAFIGI